ncbi:MAG: hypothetical protein ACRC18_07055 [Cetobacterium sp.]
MANITKEQVIKINSKCDNGFKLDIEYFLIHGEKRLNKQISINKNMMVECKIQFNTEYENSQGYNRPTGKLIPTLQFTKWSRRDEDSLYTSSDWGKKKEISNERPARRNMALLQKLTSNFNEDTLKALIIEFYGNIFEEVATEEAETIELFDLIEEVEDVTDEVVAAVEETQVNFVLVPEVVESAPAPEVEEVKEDNASIEDVKIVLNEEKNGVEIHFTSKPSEEIRNAMKGNGFRYSKYNKCWYAKQSEKTLNFAYSLTNASNEYIEQQSTEIETTEEDETKETIINEINNSLYNTEKAFNNMYNNKCYVVASCDKIDDIFKTKRGARGYVKRHSNGYYCEYSMEMGYPAYDIIEILESDLKGFNQFTLWNEELKYYMSRPWMLSSIEYFIKYVTNNDLLKYINTSIEDIKNGEGLAEPTEQIALEKGFSSAEEYQSYLDAEEDAKWAEYEAQQAEENAKYEEYKKKLDADKEILNTCKAETVETGKDIFLCDVNISCKYSSIEEIESEDSYSSKQDIIINEYLELDNNTFNTLSNNLLQDFEQIAKRGGTRIYNTGTKQEIDYDNTEESEVYNNKNNYDYYSSCILIYNKDKTKYIVVDPQGFDYCRYTGILTKEEGEKVLKQLKGEIKINTFDVIENNQERSEQQSNIQLVESLYYDIEALEQRLQLVTSNKLKYKIQSQIHEKNTQVAKIILNDPILYAQFMHE